MIPEESWLVWIIRAELHGDTHLHLLVKDTGGDVTGKSMQLIAGRRVRNTTSGKSRRGLFWEDRYSAIAIQADAHLMDVWFTSI